MQLAVETKEQTLRRDPGQNAAGQECLHASGKGAQPLAPPWSFASLIHPTSAQEFCRRHWGRQPLRIARGKSDFYAGLFSLPELERYLSLDEVFEMHSVATPSREDGPPDPPPASVSEIYERLLNGRSLRLRRMERFLDPGAPAVSLLRSMELTLQHPCDSLSCYVAAPGARGLGPHHDETEIFTLQISGTKRWRLFHRVDSDQPGLHETEHLGEATDDFVLEPGDLLYVPAGYVHDVTTTGEPSFSLTIVFAPFKWSALLELLAARLGQTTAFLEPVPAGALSEDMRPDTFRREFEARLGLIREELFTLSADAFIDLLGERFVRGTTMPPDPQLENLFSLGTMSLETRLEKRPGIACHLTRTRDKIRLTLPGGYMVEANVRAEHAFRQVMAADHAFCVSQMHESLSDGAKLALATRMVACGLLRLASAELERDRQ